MTTAKFCSRLAAFVAGVGLLGGVTWAAVSGTVTAVTAYEISVSGAVYKMDQGTSLEDLGGEHVAFSELRPGTPVELEFDEEGHLVTIRAILVR